MRFLISRLSSMGDVVCSLPAATALKQGFPECHITWIVDPRFAPIVRGCSAVDEVVEAKVTSLRTVPRFTAPFDAALDLQGLLKSALPVALCSSKKKLGYHWQREVSWLFSAKVLPDATSVHIVDQYVDVARAAGGVSERAEFSLRPAIDDLANVKERLGKGNFVLLNPGAAWATKRWPFTSFSQLVDRVHASGNTAVLIGAKAEAEVGKEISTRCERPPLQWQGETSLGELLALIALSRAHVGGDTGSTHLAAALGVPAIGLYSITSPSRSCPYGQIDRCLYNEKYIADISVDDVWQKLEEVLA